MHEPRPYGRFGSDLSEEDAAAADALMRRLTNLKTLSGLDAMKMVRSLPSGRMAIAQDAGGTLRLIIQPIPEEKLTTRTVSRAYIPMLFSGVIDNGMVENRDGAKIFLKITEMTRRRLVSYDHEKKLPPKVLELQRFVIPHEQRFSELMQPGDGGGAVKWTQYVNQRPSWYSGAMAEVVQIVGGYGRQDLNELPDDPLERSRLSPPEDISKAMIEEIGNVILPGYTGAPDLSGEFKYDYKFNNTHGVGFDSNSRPWLLQVSQSGVYAMPLPLIPATTTEVFRRYIEDAGDSEILWILDRFGGMPSGESFPLRNDDFQCWRRAGVIIKVCEAGDFYHHIMYSSALGWSFNVSGNEGFNTCYDYNEDEGLAIGLAYKLKLDLGIAENEGRVKIPEDFQSDDPATANMLNGYLSSLYRLIGESTPKNLAIKYKLRCVDVDTVLDRVGGTVNEAEVDYWHNMEMQPIAEHSGRLTEVGRGYLYHPAKFFSQPQIKFPEPTQRGCLSFDFAPLAEGLRKNPRCDTIMFGYYIGDQLKVVKYFRDDRSFPGEVESDYEDCMTVGSWTQTETTGQTGLVGNFYTSDFDERKALAPVVTTTKIVGKDLGYDSNPIFAFDALFWRPGSLWRNRYYSRKANIVKTEGKGLSIAVCIPYLARNCVYHALSEVTTGGTTTDSLSLESVQDPYTYRYWTYHSIFAWNGGLSVMKGMPSPKDGNPVWVEMEDYSPDRCSDFADQGPWIPSLPADYTWLIHPRSNEWILSGGGGAPKLNTSYITKTNSPSKTGELFVSILESPSKVNSKPSNDFFLSSPNELGWIFYTDAIKLTAGDSEYANTLESDAPGRKPYGFTSLATNQSAHHFIGVINE